jgi:hypothetical protein
VPGKHRRQPPADPDFPLMRARRGDNAATAVDPDPRRQDKVFGAPGFRIVHCGDVSIAGASPQTRTTISGLAAKKGAQD